LRFTADEMRTLPAAVAAFGACLIVLLLSACDPLALRVWPPPEPDMTLGLDQSALGLDQSVDQASLDLGSDPNSDLQAVESRDLGMPAQARFDPRYVGTCMAPLFDCFDWALPCTQQSVGQGIAYTASNGAVGLVSLVDGSTEARSSQGALCFTLQALGDPPVYIYTSPSGEYRVRVEQQGAEYQQVITCPDGTIDIAPSFGTSFARDSVMCTR
jgi:hypothetical protein